TVGAKGPNGLTGSVNGTITGTVEPLPDTVADIALTPSATIVGTVYQPGGSDTVAGARVSISGSGTLNTVTDQHGQYRVDFVPLGQLSVRADAPIGFNRGIATVTAATAGETLTVNVTLLGVGTVTGDAFDSNGTTKLTSGTVSFTNAEIGTPVVLNAQVQP